jgi:hypothetical protein
MWAIFTIFVAAKLNANHRIMREALKTAHPLIQVGILTLLGFGAMFVCLSLVFAVVAASGQPLTVLSDPTSLTDPDSMGVMTLKFLQIMQSIGLFFVPYLIFRSVIGGHQYDVVRLDRRWGMLFVFAFTMIAALPLINFMADWNSNIQLPGFLSGVEEWMRSTEKDAERLIKTFLTMDTVGELLFNLFLIAFLPAVCEELFFRGMMQPLVLRSVKNVHLAVWITAFLFSFFHMQFLGFFPRLILGAVLGYAAHWSGTLMLPMVGHLLNNGLAVLATWYIGIDAMQPEMETLGANEGEGMIVVLATAVVLAGMFSLYMSSKRLQKKTATTSS